MKHIVSFTDRFPDLREDLQDLFLEFQEDHGFQVNIITDVKIIPAVKTSQLLVGHNFTYPPSYQRDYGYTPVGDWMWGYVVLLSKVVRLDKKYKATKKRGKYKREVGYIDKSPTEKVTDFVIKKSKLIIDRTPKKIELYGVRKATSENFNHMNITRDDDNNSYYVCRYELAFI